MNFILGTATFSNSYGVANQTQDVIFEEPIVMMDAAMNLGIQSLDTAPAYGGAERVIGNYHKSHNRFKIHTKLSETSAVSASLAIASIRESIYLMNIEKLDVLYFHSAESFLGNSDSGNASVLNAIQDTGLVEKIGISVYTESEIRKIVLRWPQIQVLQIPENILDQRLLNSELVGSLAKTGREFIVRSVFLQGLLLMESGNIPDRLSETKENIAALNRFAVEQNMTRLEAAVNYLNLLDWASGFVIGAVTANQLFQILNCKVHELNREQLPTPLTEPLIDPRNW
jgi:aryl-alcohol dehydrogenase-like predicted oxidoreductase